MRAASATPFDDGRDSLIRQQLQQAGRNLHQLRDKVIEEWREKTEYSEKSREPTETTAAE